jgi:hypothetical protein
MGFLGRFRKRQTPASHADQDRIILMQLRRLGAELTLPRHVVHYLYFGDEANARRAAEESSKAAWETSVNAPSERIPQWSVPVEATRVVDKTTVDASRAWFEQLADECSGEYDGWEAAAEP